MNEDLEHLRLLSIFHYVVGGLLALVACFPLIHVTVGLMMILSPGQLGSPPRFIGFLFLVVGGTLVMGGWTLAGFIIYAGRCLSEHRRHTLCLVVAGIACAFMPFGTVLGVFTIIVLMRPSVKALFGVESHGADFGTD